DPGADALGADLPHGRVPLHPAGAPAIAEELEPPPRRLEVEVHERHRTRRGPEPVAHRVPAPAESARLPGGNGVGRLDREPGEQAGIPPAGDVVPPPRSPGEG